MSGLINELLHEHYDRLGYNLQKPVIETKDVPQEINVLPTQLPKTLEEVNGSLNTLNSEILERYKYDPTISQWFDTETDSYIGKVKPA